MPDKVAICVTYGKWRAPSGISST